MDMFRTKNLKKLNMDLRRIGKELLEEGQMGVATRIEGIETALRCPPSLTFQSALQ